MNIELTIPGPPMGKQRPRVCKFGTYTPAKTVNYETLVKELYIMQYPQRKPMDDPLQMTVLAYFPIPKSKSKKMREQMLNNTIKPTIKPDTDNVLKIIADSLNGLAYADDKQIVCASVYKFYSDNPRVEVCIVNMNENL